MQIKRLLDDRGVFVGSKVSTLRSNPILRKPLLTEGVFFLGIADRFFYIQAQESYTTGIQLVWFLVGIGKTKS